MDISSLNLFGFKPKGFGLEIEEDSLKAFQLIKKRNSFVFAACSRKEIAKGTVSGGQVLNKENLAKEIKGLVASSRPQPIKTKHVVISIPENKAFIRTIQIPKMSKDESVEAVKWETEANIPITTDKVYLDWQMTEEKGNQQEVLVVAVPKNIVDDCYEAVVMAGLKPLAVEIDIIATIRSLTNGENNKKPLLIAEIGARRTSLAICKNQIPYFTSSIPLSGASFTESLQKELGISYSKAEETKIKFGLGKMREDDTLFKIYNPLVENLADEIEKSISFYNESINKTEQVEEILLSGGGALVKELDIYLGERLKKKVILGNPEINLDLNKFAFKISKRDLLSYATSIGLALRGADYEN